MRQKKYIYSLVCIGIFIICYHTRALSCDVIEYIRDGCVSVADISLETKHRICEDVPHSILVPSGATFCFVSGYYGYKYVASCIRRAHNRKRYEYMHSMARELLAFLKHDLLCTDYMMCNMLYKYVSNPRLQDRCSMSYVMSRVSKCNSNFISTYVLLLKRIYQKKIIS
jgi:hypothetical protein